MRDILLRNETAYERLTNLAVDLAAFKDCALHRERAGFVLNGPNGCRTFALTGNPSTVNISDPESNLSDLHVPFDEAMAHLRYLAGRT